MNTRLRTPFPSLRAAFVIGRAAFVVAVGLTAGLAIAPDALAGRLVFKEEVIEGEVQKPEVTVFLTRQNLNDRYQLELQESFLPKIIEAVRHTPF